MVEKTLKVRVEPDTRQLDRELKRDRRFSTGGLAGLGGVGGRVATGAAAGVATAASVGTSLKTLTKAVPILGAILSVMDATRFIWEPFAKIFTAIIALLFLPLVPILKPTLKKLAEAIPILAAGSTKLAQFLDSIGAGEDKNLFGGFVGLPSVSSVQEQLNSLQVGWEGLKNAGKFLFDLTVKGFEILTGVGIMVWEEIIRPGFALLGGVGVMLWNTTIKPGFSFLLNVGQMLWSQVILKGFSFLGNAGQMIWDIIKGGFDFITRALKSVANAIIDIINAVNPFGDIPHLAEGGVVTKPTLAVIGERGPEAIVPLNQAGGFGMGGNVTQNITIHAVLNNDMDVQRVAERLAEFHKEELARTTNSQRF